MNILKGYLLVIFSILLITNACKKDENLTTIRKKITGKVQKGPYIDGGIYISELHPYLVPSGKDYSVYINDNGLYVIDGVSFSSRHLQLMASGPYYNEITGSNSISYLTLSALADIKEISSVNINILTHLECSRVKYLVNNLKYAFSEAKKKAQEEILAAFGIIQTGLNSSEILDITINKEENAILLALSIIFQGNRDQGPLMELFENIGNDIQYDGILNDKSILTDLRNSTIQLNLPEIRTNLENHYEGSGIDATIPNFEKYINDFLIFTE